MAASVVVCWLVGLVLWWLRWWVVLGRLVSLGWLFGIGGFGWFGLCGGLVRLWGVWLVGGLGGGVWRLLRVQFLGWVGCFGCGGFKRREAANPLFVLTL